MKTKRASLKQASVDIGVELRTPSAPDEENGSTSNVSANHDTKTPISVQRNVFDNTCTIDSRVFTAGELVEYIKRCKDWDESQRAHPLCFVTDVLCVLPNWFRLWTKNERNMDQVHSWTKCYHELYKLSVEITLEQNRDVRDASMHRLYVRVNKFLETRNNNRAKGGGGGGNGRGGASNNPGYDIRPILSSLVGKESGLLRSTMVGKTVSGCGRAIVVPAPVRIDEISVPDCVCRQVGFLEHVNPLNIDKIRKLVTQGDVFHIYNKYGDRFAGTVASMREIEVGGSVERCIQTGDIAVANRQPTLHQGSMMAFKVVRCKEGLVLGINPINAASFNADYDGDEMNIHFPYTQQTRAEVETLMGMEHRIMGNSGKLQLGLIQNQLTAIYRLTKPETRIYKGDMVQYLPMDLVIDIINDSAFFTADEEDRYPGISLVSVLFKPYKLPNDHPLVRNHRLISGPLTSEHIGTSGKLLELVWFESNLGCKRLLELMQQVANVHMCVHPVSCGVFDCRAPDEGTNAILDELPRGSIDFSTSTRILHAFQTEVLRDDKFMSADNGLVEMAKSGAKGSIANLAGISVFMGQQRVNGNKIPEYIQGNRILPTTDPDNMDWIDYGIVRGNLLKGLNNRQSAITSLDGRSGIIQRSVCTRESGKSSRDMYMRFGNYYVAADSTVRDSGGFICQFAYGGDGVDPRYTKYLRWAGRGTPCFIYKTPYITKRFSRDPSKYLVQYGEPVGVISANSTAQPLIQSVMNTMHKQNNEPGGVSTNLLDDILKVPIKRAMNKITVNCYDAKRALWLFHLNQPRSSAILTYDFSESFPCEEEWTVVYDRAFKRVYGDQKHVGMRCLVLRLDAEKLRSMGIIAGLECWLLARLMDVSPPQRYFRASPPLEGGKYIDLHVGLLDDEDFSGATLSKIVALALGKNSLKIHDIQINEHDEKQVFVFTKEKLSWAFVTFERFGDPLKMDSDNMRHILECLGVQATREALYLYLRNLDILKGQMDYRYLSFIADTMTYRGQLTPITYSGMKMTRGNVLTRAIYRNPVRVIVNAAANNTFDRTRDMLANVAVGKKMEGGSGSSFVVFDQKDDDDDAKFGTETAETVKKHSVYSYQPGSPQSYLPEFVRD